MQNSFCTITQFGAFTRDGQIVFVSIIAVSLPIEYIFNIVKKKAKKHTNINFDMMQQVIEAEFGKITEEQYENKKY